MLCDSPNFNKLSSPSEPANLNKNSLHDLDNPLSPPCVNTNFILPKTPSLTQPSSPTSLNLNDQLVPDVDKNESSFDDRLNNKTRAPNSSSITRRFHPNIHHHPTIHPHNHYQRHLFNKNIINNSASSVPNSNDTNKKMPEECNIEASVVPVVNNKNNNNSSSKNNNENDNGLDVSSSCSDFSNSENNVNKETIENDIKLMQDLIDKLNSEIFKNPQNYTRPPSEYLEIYNKFTEKLHSLQLKKQQLIDEANRRSRNLTDNEDNFKNNNNDVDMNEPTNNYENLNDEYEQQFSLSNLNSPIRLDSKYNEFDSETSTNFNLNDPLQSTNYFIDARKPPLPKQTNNQNTNGAVPRFKLDHPTSLSTSYNSNNNYNNTTKQHATTPTLTSNSFSYNNNFMSASTTTSPASTPSFTPSSYNNYIDKINFKNGLSISPPKLNTSLTTSTSSTSLPSANNLIQSNTMNNNNNNINSALTISSLTHNSRSFGDINEAIIINPTLGQTPNSSLSPPSSIATTPTYSTLSSSFLRIYIGSSTAVIEKKPIPLKEALSNKLKRNNLDIDKCLAYLKDSNYNYKIDWDTDVNKLNADSIVVAEQGDEIRHSYEKKTFTLKSCDSCKKRFLLNVYSCTKCDYTMCQKNECRTKSERTVCVPKKPVSIISSNGVYSTLNKPEIESYPESPIRETSINISQQILPVHQLKVYIPSRDRSRSETELNMFNPKLTIDPSRPVPKSPSSQMKVVNPKNIYGTMPRNQLKPTHVLVTDTNLDEISGNLNEVSGSVINSMNKNVNIEKNSNPHQIKPKLNKPNRRDSFNSWEIPFSQIKVDHERKIGSGSFGIVHQGTDFYHGTVAIKFLNVQNPTPQQSSAFRNEVAILKSTRHDNILLFIGCIFRPYLAIVTEWCPASSLYKHIHVEEEHWEMNQLIDIAKQTATGMEYLHARDILHRDLKSNNIFLIPKEANNMQHYRPNGINKLNDFLNDQLVENWRVKIGDFGLATVKSTWTQSSAKTTQPTGSILWMAPEVITQKVPDPYTQKSDVYSYAVVLYELVTSHLPHLNKEQNMILFLVGSGRLKLNPEDSRSDTPKEIKDLIVLCSEFDRDKRLDFVGINKKLKNIRLAKQKSKLQRAQSLPNLNLTPNVLTQMGGLMNIYEDDMYSPHLDLSPKYSPTLKTVNFMNFNNTTTNTSQLITNL